MSSLPTAHLLAPAVGASVYLAWTAALIVIGTIRNDRTDISTADRGRVRSGGGMKETLLYIGGALTIVWGTAHLYPTRQIVHGFGDISRENRLVLIMEWTSEAVLLIFTGGLVVVMVARFGAGNAATHTACLLSAAMLLIWAAISAATGGRVDFIMYRLCAPIFTLSATLILVGAFS